MDNAGNNEETGIIEIKLDKSFPEFIVDFDPIGEDFRITTSEGDIDCSHINCTSVDEAGNTSRLSFKK